MGKKKQRGGPPGPKPQPKDPRVTLPVPGIPASAPPPPATGKETEVIPAGGLSKQTPVTIGLVSTIVVGVVIGVWGYAEIVHKMNDLDKEIDHLRSHIDERTESRFTKEDFESEFSSWVRIFKASNQAGSVVIPDAEDR